MDPNWVDDYTMPPVGPPPGPAASNGPPATTPTLPTETPSHALMALPRVGAGASRAKAGLGVVLAAAGAGVGAFFGGATGAGAGLLITGGARNLYRAQAGLGSEDGMESAKSLTLGLLGLAAGGYLVYRCFRKDKKT